MKVIVWIIVALVSLPLMTTRRSSKSSRGETSTFAVLVESLSSKSFVVVAPSLSDAAIASDLSEYLYVVNTAGKCFSNFLSIGRSRIF